MARHLPSRTASLAGPSPLRPLCHFHPLPSRSNLLRTAAPAVVTASRAAVAASSLLPHFTLSQWMPSHSRCPGWHGCNGCQLIPGWAHLTSSRLKPVWVIATRPRSSPLPTLSASLPAVSIPSQSPSNPVVGHGHTHTRIHTTRDPRTVLLSFYYLPTCLSSSLPSFRPTSFPLSLPPLPPSVIQSFPLPASFVSLVSVFGSSPSFRFTDIRSSVDYTF